MLPVSLMLSVPPARNRGGAKSRAVKVPDLRSACLEEVSTTKKSTPKGPTYGLGMAARSSKDDVSGI